MTNSVASKFQSRAGFSECLDLTHTSVKLQSSIRFNPVLGFLSVSTSKALSERATVWAFQSRAGFSECLDRDVARDLVGGLHVSIPCWVF